MLSCTPATVVEYTAVQKDTFSPFRISDSDVMETVVKDSEMSARLFISRQVNIH